MLNSLRRARRLLTLDELKPIPSIEKSEHWELLRRATLNDRRCSLAVLLKL